MSAGFVHLHLHSEYSMVDSTVRIPGLVARCKAQGMPAVALTDKNNLFGLVKFYRKAMAQGVKPVIGLDLRIANDEDPEHPFTLLLFVQKNLLSTTDLSVILMHFSSNHLHPAFQPYGDACP